MKVAVTGANGRLGRALMQALGDSPYVGPSGPVPWTRAEFDLDDPGSPGELLDRARIEVVIHAAAWTDVDGCAREPDVAHRRNAEATGILARATAERGITLIHVSTNEVFDGRRAGTDGYGPGDPPNPINAYGASKAGGERLVEEAYADRGDQWHIVRTSWLFGPPGRDFPDKILEAATRARSSGEPLKLVGDERGSPTYTHDLADAIIDLMTGYDLADHRHHLVNAGVTSRAGWARELLRQAGVEVDTQDVPASTWPRASTPPLNATLAPTPLPSGEPIRPWQEAVADYLPILLRLRQRTAAAR